MTHAVCRRQFLANTLQAGAVAGAVWSGSPLLAAPRAATLEAGEGVVQITPPLGIELAGFHRTPGKERLITGIRQTPAARALVLRCGGVEAAVVSLDLIGVSREFAARVQRRAGEATGIDPRNIRVCVTHTHSMPTFLYLRQWGKIPDEFQAQTEERAVQALQLAKADLAPAELHVGQSNAVGGNFNRTSSTWKTDREWSKEASDDERWLDTALHVLRLERGSQRDLLWYHFSAHPVCFGDGLAGPDWVGGVLERVKKEEGLEPGFLQGHCGDVNPGDGSPWIGNYDETVENVYAAFRRALEAAVRVPVDQLRVVTSTLDVPVDRERLRAELEQYRTEPEKCIRGPWVDAPFAAAWYEAASKWNLETLRVQTPLSAWQLGPLGFLFHGTELYSYYGLAIRHRSPCQHTLVVGYTDDLIGYVTDPKAYAAGEYAAVTVPKIVNLPPFQPTAGRELTAAASDLLARLA